MERLVDQFLTGLAKGVGTIIGVLAAIAITYMLAPVGMLDRAVVVVQTVAACVATSL